MAVPQHQLYSVKLANCTATHATRSGVVSGYKLLDANRPYIMTGKMIEKLELSDAKLTSTPVNRKGFSDSTKKLLVFFPAGIGDVISLRPVLQDFKAKYPHVEIGVVSTIADQCLVGDLCTLWDYPIREEVALYYDSWINIAQMNKESFSKELPALFAEYLGIDAPTRPPRLVVDKYYKESLSNLIVDRSKVNVGVHLSSACHFRSMPPILGTYAMMELVENGCHCYSLGGSDQPLVYYDSTNGERVEPPDGIFDFSVTLGPIEHLIAFYDCMDVVLTVDTSGLHIAGALGKPTVAVFGMTRGSCRTSYYPTVTVIQGEYECSPCERIIDDNPCEEKWCMAIASIDPSFLAAKVLEAYDGFRKDNLV